MILASWTFSTYLFLVGAVPIGLSLAIPLVVSALGFLRTRGVFDRIGGEKTR